MKETRIIRGEIRAADCNMGQMRVAGIAARYVNPTVIGSGSNRKGVRGFREVLAKGAFRFAVQSKQDTKFLINHDVNRLMGSVAAGTLRLRDTDEGLEFEADLPDTEDAKTAYQAIQRGDMNGCSFGFGDCDDEWDIDSEDGRAGRMARRTIKNIRSLLDVSAVTFPAYSNTSVGVRSFENRSEVEIPEQFQSLVFEEPETDSVEAIARRRQLLGISLL